MRAHARIGALNVLASRCHDVCYARCCREGLSLPGKRKDRKWPACASLYLSTTIVYVLV